MSWADCGNDCNGRPIGYIFTATCDSPDCEKIIDRGLAYACGGMHGEDEFSCEKYFCGDHLFFLGKKIEELRGPVCSECAQILEDDKDL